MSKSRRATCLCVAVVALGLSAHALRVLNAERVYAAALGYEHRAALDRPGRLEAYETAAHRDPGEARYAYRAAQLRLQRAAAATLDERRAHLDSARDWLRRALRLRPFDGEIRSTSAQAYGLSGAHRAAVREAERAVALAPRSPTIIERTLRAHVVAWRRTADAEHLRRVFELTREAAASESSWLRGVAVARLSTKPEVGLHDLLEALVARPDLLREAAVAYTSARPKVALRLREQADLMDRAE